MCRIWLWLSCLTAGCLLLAGCNSRESLKSSFRDAPLNMREQVEEAIRLDRANNYMHAAEHYDVVLRGELTSQQRLTVQASIDQLFSRMSKAAAQGNSEAMQTLKLIEAGQKARP
jgi:hypothetical protein